ncbi:hypothetical protein FACS1894166_11400 [Bacilli bacterium]|nr:hypothetical protein FACS1894166_11400 [Bacilli bacterium]
MQVDWYTCHWGNTPHTKGNTRASDFHYTIPTLVIPYARFNPDTYDNDYGFTAQYDYGNDTKGQDLDNDPSTIFTYV